MLAAGAAGSQLSTLLLIGYPMAMDEQPESVAALPTLLAGCEQRIGYTFSDKDLLQAALTHASGAEHRLASNERLEFLGDAILGAVVCELLFHQYPEYLEGDLTEIKSIVVSRQTCAKISEVAGDAGVPDPRQGDDHASRACRRRCWPTCSNRWWRPSIWTAATRRPRTFVERHMGPEIELAAGGEMGSNYKSMLQQLAQREHGTTPTYQLLDEKGPGPQQVLQDRGPGGQQPVSSRLGAGTRRKPSSGPRATP